MSVVTSTIERLKPADLRRDPREELRNMSVRDEARAILQKRLPPGAALVDDTASDPYDDSGASGRSFSLLRASERTIVLLQIPLWIADDGRSVGALDETRYAFRGKTVRIVAEGLDAPSLGLDTLIGNWKRVEQIDADFIAWRYIKEMGDGRHSLSRVLRIDRDFPASADAAPSVAPAAGPKVFVSYAHDDSEWFDKLMTQLAPIARKFDKPIWSDLKLTAGENWRKGIGDALESSPIVILLVSPYFISSDFIHAHEFGVALEQARRGKKTLLWVYVTACPFESTGMADYQAAHDIAVPLDQLKPGAQWAQLKKVHDNLAAALQSLER
jgi:hypothetical protein